MVTRLAMRHPARWGHAHRAIAADEIVRVGHGTDLELRSRPGESNDIPIVSRLPVPLTTVRVPFPEIAVGALELLHEASNDDPARTLIAAPTLIPRKSTVACK